MNRQKTQNQTTEHSKKDANYEHLMPKLFFAALALALLTASLTVKVEHYGDASNYLMITQSILYDHDLEYERKDYTRAIEAGLDQYTTGLFFIQREDGRYFFAKSFLYSLFSVPFFAAFGLKGFLVFNALMFWAMIYAGYLFLRQKNGQTASIILSTAFFSLSSVYIYVYWVHADIFNFFLVTMAMFFLMRDTYRSPYYAALIIGLAAYAKEPNIVLAIPLVASLAGKKGLKELAICLTIIVAAYAIPWLAEYESSHAPTPYSGNRTSYGAYPPFSNNMTSRSGFTVEGQLKNVDTGADIQTLPENTVYYLIGRYTGILIYYTPLLLCLALMEKPDRRKQAILIAVALNAAAWMLFRPMNFVGLTHIVGNRYFYVYPLFLFLVDRIRINKAAIAVSALILLFPATLVINPEFHSGDPAYHTRNPLYSLFPEEMTLYPNLWHKYTMKRPGYTIFLDDETDFPPENTGLSLQRNTTTSIYIMASETKRMTFNASTGPAPVRITATTGGRTQTINLGKNEDTTFTVDVEPIYDYEYLNLGTSQNKLYMIGIECTGGYVPALTFNKSRDTRNLCASLTYPKLEKTTKEKETNVEG